MIIEKPQLSLEIPGRLSVRNEIRRKVDDYFREHPKRPPFTWEELSEFAGVLICRYGWDKTFNGFIMLCCGNAIWRKIVEAIPFNRRILMLPQCLKNSLSCNAEMDNIGLLCNDCGSCSISSLLHEAENLGYVALVTEGTTITTRLIESGKVDAVIGVGCMDVLQKMFRSVSKYAIPGIGIPLLSDGCKDTKADLSWVRQELYRYREDRGIRLLNLNHIRNKTASLFGEEQLKRLILPGPDRTLRIVIESLTAGGQRVRPFLSALAYEAYCTEPDEALLNRLVLSVESFHKASLIHDDIEDEDVERYGKQTINAKHGTAVAINSGDLLIGEGYRLIAESGMPPEKIASCIRVISAGHRDMTLGQGEELLATQSARILPLDEIINVFANKTSSAFRVALLLGGIIGGADEIDLEQLKLFSQFTGIAYQIMDDLEDDSGKKMNYAFSKPSFLLAVLMDELPGDEKAIIQQAFASRNNDLIQVYLHNYKTAGRCTLLLKEKLEGAKQSLENLGNIGLKLALHEILGKIFSDYL
ncbi:MAG: polyprenyl synthetase family protein [Bacteroidota bacterium]